MQEHSLKKRYIIKLFANIISAVIGAIIVAIVPRALGPIAYGQFVYLQEFFLKIIGFLDFGSSIAFFTKLSARHERKELIGFYFLYSFLLLVVVFCFVLASDYFGFADILAPNIPTKYIYMGVVFGFFTWFTGVFIKISDAYALTVSVEIIKIVHKIISLILILYFVYVLTFDLESYFYFHYIALLSFLFILTWLFIKKGIFKNILNSQLSIFNLIKEFFTYCHPLVVSGSLGIIVGLIDIWLLQKISGSEQTGFYGLAYSLAAMCFLFTSAMTPLITREFSKSYEEKDLANMKSLFTRYIPMLYSIAAYFAVFVSVQSENVLTIFTDEQFKGAFFVLVVMAFYPIHQTYGQLSGSVFHATGQTKLYRNISLFTQPVGLVISIILLYIFEFGAMGLAIKMIIIQFVGVNIQLYFNAKLLDLDIKQFLWHQIYSVVFFALLALVPTLFVSFDSVLAEFFVSGFVYTLFVIIFGYVFPQVFALTRRELHETISLLQDKILK